MAAQISSASLNRQYGDADIKSGLRLLTSQGLYSSMTDVELILAPFGGCPGINLDSGSIVQIVATTGLRNALDPRDLRTMISSLIGLIESSSLSNFLICCTESLLLWNDPIAVASAFQELDRYCRINGVTGYVLVRENMVSVRDFVTISESISS